MNPSTKRVASSVNVGSLDLSDLSRRGTYATKISCAIFAHADGSWECLGNFQEGEHNQEDIFLCSLFFGSWLGFGSTAELAVASMVGKAQASRFDMEQAAQQALLECQDEDYNSLEVQP